MNEISTFLTSRIDAGDFPSAVYLVAEKGEVVRHEALGFAVVEPERIEARLDTIYDLASLTKVLVTGLLMARLIEGGKLTIEDKVSGLLREFDESDITVSELVTHTSGLPAWRPLYLDLERGTLPAARVSAFIAKLPLAGSVVVYSDLGFVLLQNVVEKACPKPLNEFFTAEVADTLGLRDTFFNPPAERRHRIAASEKGNE